MRSPSRPSPVAVLILIAGLSAVVSPASAAPQASAALSASAAPPTSAQERPSLAVTPAVSELSLVPGGATLDRVQVINRSDTTLKVVATSGDISQGPGGGFVFQRPQSRPDSAVSWLAIDPSTFQIPPGSATTVTTSVRAPEGAPVGGHYAGIRFAASPGAASPGSTQQALHALLIEVTGAGLARSGRLVRLSLPKFEVNGEVPFDITIDNTGNTHLAVDGTIEVRDRILRRVVARIPVPRLWVLPGGPMTARILWRDPPRLVAMRATARVVLLRSESGQPQFVDSVSANGVVMHWAVIALIAAALLLLRLLIGLTGARRRRNRRRLAARAPTPERPGSHAAPEPARSAWDPPPARTAGSFALRRARTALAMIREGAGKTGVRLEVAIGLLRTVRDSPEVVAAVEAAYRDAAGRRRPAREAAGIALALAAVGSVEAPEALLRGYATADRVLAARLRRALAECDPADLRAHPDLLGALPQARRQALPVS